VFRLSPADSPGGPKLIFIHLGEEAIPGLGFVTRWSTHSNLSMITESSTVHEIRAGIIADTKAFLTGLESGATDEQLRAVLQRIREKESQLLKVGGTMIDPKIWTILHNRLAQRDAREIIDNTDPAGGLAPKGL
jgi:hypothetical protein